VRKLALTLMNISVAMCTYNGARYVREQLDSIATQTRRPDELVVCDDKSSDATCKIVTSFAASVPFPVRLYVNQQNLGSTKNFERAIAFCEGDVIVLSDQDDVWLPGKLREIESCFIRNGRVLDVLLPGWTVTGATMAFRAGFKNLVLDIPTDVGLIHDGWIALMIASVADVSFIEEPLIQYRQHQRQQIGAKDRKAPLGGARALGGVTNAMQRKNSYQEIIEIGTKAHRRLLKYRDLYKSDDALSRLEARLKHLRARAHLPDERLSRVCCVITELLSRRYHLYSNGFRSAVKDLLA
jgi:glycosyltransferase involved in cell wall biosynthesis